MSRVRLSAILIMLCVLTACHHTSVLERQSILVSLAYEAKENKTFQVTGTFIEAQPEVKETSRTVSVEADTSKGARLEMNQMLPYQVASGQIRVILLNRDIFRLNMVNEIDVLSRDPFFGDMIKVAIVDGSPEDLLTHSYKNYSNIGISLNNLLEHNTRVNWVPNMTLHDFTRTRGINRLDMAVPVIKREEEEIILSSLALIHEDKIVGDATPNEAFFLKTLKGSRIPYLYELKIKKEEMKSTGMDRFFIDGADEVKVVFNVTRNKGKIKLVDQKNIIFDARIDIDVDIQEVSEKYKFNEKGAVDALENQLNIELSNHLQQFLDKLRKVNSDCVGFGEVYRSKVGQSAQVEEIWSKEFPESTIKGKVKIDIIRTGIIE